MATRLDALRERLEEPLLVTDLTNIEYLTGFASSNAALLVGPGVEATLYTDFRYLESARDTAKDVRVEQAQRSLIADLQGKLPARVQFEADALPYAQWQVLNEHGAVLIPARGLVESVRAVKDADEVEKLRAACALADQALAQLIEEPIVGKTEKQVAARLRELVYAAGADELSFDSIVASGRNGAMPHAHPTDQTIERGTLVTIDWGARLDGYYSDCTRAYSTGDLPDRLREAYDVCLEAQIRACENIEAGMTGVQADELAREPITDAGFGEAFGHGLGHGVGLAVHEDPRLSTQSPDTLVAGNAITIEPGIYLEGLGGVRIEDLAIVRDDGIEILTSLPKTLTEVS